MLKRYDEENIEKTYDGSNGLKECVKIGDEYWMVKSHSKREKGSLIYTNSIYSEYVGFKVFKLYGIPVQDVMLGKHIFKDGKERDSVYCKDIEFNTGLELVSFKELFNTIGNSDIGQRISLNEFLEVIKNQCIIDKGECINWFYKVYAIDTLLSNPDRHLGNIAVMHNRCMRDYKLAPIYDNGSCLYPEMPDDIIDKILLNDRNDIVKRVNIFMTSAFLDDDGEKINYREYALREKDINILEAYSWLVNEIDINIVIKKIQELEDVPQKLRDMYSVMIKERYKGIILETLSKWV